MMGFAKAQPILLLADLPLWQIKSGHWAAANQPDGQITSDFQKSCQAPKSKIFHFASYPNQFTDSHRPVPQRGVAHVTKRGAGCGGRGQHGKTNVLQRTAKSCRS